MLTNLPGNVSRFTREAVDAKLALGAEDVSGQVWYYVRDNGVGFDMAYADKLFQAFRRLHREDEFEGSAIGLATVDRIVKRHGGRVRTHGEVGEGAGVHFTLPAGHALASGWAARAPSAVDRVLEGARYATANPDGRGFRG